MCNFSSNKCHKHNANPFVCNFIHLLLRIALFNGIIVCDCKQWALFVLNWGVLSIHFYRVCISFTIALNRPEKWGPVHACLLVLFIASIKIKNKNEFIQNMSEYSCEQVFLKSDIKKFIMIYEMPRPNALDKRRARMFVLTTNFAICHRIITTKFCAI